MNSEHLIIGSVIYIIDAQFEDSAFYVKELKDTLDARFREANFGYELEVSIIKTEESCIQVEFLIVLNLAGTFSIIKFIKDYPDIKQGLREIIGDVKGLANKMCDKKPVQVICQNAKFNKSFYGPIGSGESLIGIVHQLDFDTYEDEQVMVAILRLNPDVFVDRNIDKMLAGKVLRLPTDYDIRKIPVDMAKQEIAKIRER